MVVRNIKSGERKNILNLMRRIYDSEFSDNPLINSNAFVERSQKGTRMGRRRF